jgi:hypothetical protein
MITKNIYQEQGGIYNACFVATTKGDTILALVFYIKYQDNHKDARNKTNHDTKRYNTDNTDKLEKLMDNAHGNKHCRSNSF